MRIAAADLSLRAAADGVPHPHSAAHQRIHGRHQEQRGGAHHADPVPGHDPRLRPLKQFQRKCAAVLHPELRANKTRAFPGIREKRKHARAFCGEAQADSPQRTRPNKVPEHGPIQSGRIIRRGLMLQRPSSAADTGFSGCRGARAGPAASGHRPDASPVAWLRIAGDRLTRGRRRLSTGALSGGAETGSPRKARAFGSAAA